MSRQLVFVYNSNSGFLNGVTDLIHKSLKKSTYPCDLCRITFNTTTMNKVWKQYINNLPIKSLFLHKNDFEKKYQDINIKYPVILLFENKKYQQIVSIKEFKNINDVTGLMSLLNTKIKIK